MILPVTIYGIKNCDTIKKARSWLDKSGISYAFHDYKTAGIDRERLERWAKKAGWEVLLNQAGTTFKKLPHKDKEGLSQSKAIALMLKATVDDQAPRARRRRRQVAGRLQPRCI
jgi:arsenate reductase